MEFRAEKRAFALLSGLGLLASAGWAQEIRYEVWHGHSRPPHIRKAGNMGTLTITDSGIAFDESYEAGKQPKHPHAWRWAYQDIQQLKIEPRVLTVLTYKDNVWKLGADRAYRFDLDGEKTFDRAYQFLKGRLDQRLVAAMPDQISRVLLEIPVKHAERFGGDEGVLQIGPNTIVYRSRDKGDSRTWRYEDIENISSAGPFQLTITTFERAKTHYGDRKGFNFQLKKRIEEAQYDDLWVRLNRSKGLQILDYYRQPEATGASNEATGGALAKSDAAMRR